MKLKALSFLVGVLISGQTLAHEMTPTYFELRPSYVDGVMTTTFRFFNRREDIRYYEISVYDKDWNKIPFAASDKIFTIEYLGRQTFDLYVREADADKVTYICTLSKAVKGDIESSIISSRICSKIKEKQ